MSAEFAPLAGIELPGDLTEEFSWDAPVWFCDPWPNPFGLAGLEGFLHHFIVSVHAYDGYLEIEPEPQL
jgi:hypothetical protein